MHETFFNHVNIPPENIHIPDGTLAADDADAFCAEYEQKIKAAGGIDLQILGIGRTGHIGFNEPGSPRNSRTRLVTLDRVTRRDAASDFFGEENVPHQAITMGVGTILDARTSRPDGVRRAQGADRRARPSSSRRRRRSPPASCRNTRTRRSCSTRPPPRS